MKKAYLSNKFSDFRNKFAFLMFRSRRTLPIPVRELMNRLEIKQTLKSSGIIINQCEILILNGT